MTPAERLDRYGDVVVRVGANVQEGQNVVVLAQVEHAEIVRGVARAAYRAGARRVDVRYADLHLRRAAIELGPEDDEDGQDQRKLDHRLPSLVSHSLLR